MRVGGGRTLPGGGLVRNPMFMLVAITVLMVGQRTFTPGSQQLPPRLLSGTFKR